MRWEAKEHVASRVVSTVMKVYRYSRGENRVATRTLYHLNFSTRATPIGGFYFVGKYATVRATYRGI